MKYPLSLEFKENVTYAFPGPGPVPGRVSIDPRHWDFARLTVAAPRPGSPDGSDRQICRTVNGIVRVELLDATPGFYFFLTASLMGSYGGLVGTIQEHTIGPGPLGLPDAITAKNPANSAGGLFSVANMSSGAFGFDYFSSYSNLADSIFIRVGILPSVNKVNINLKISGVLLAADPA
jgi:hypothetical protein